MATDFMGIDWTGSSAQDIIKAALKPYGLDDPGLINSVYNAGKNEGSDAAYLFLRSTPQYKAAFPGMEMRAKNGLAPISEEQYNQWKSAMISTMKNNGIPAGFYDSPDDFATFIGNDISPSEVQDRVVKGVVAARNAPQEVKDALFNFYGIDEGHLAAYWLDPTPGRGEALLKQQAATYIGGAAQRARYAGLTAAEAENIASHGVDPNQAEQNLGDLVQGQQLLNALPGEVLSSMSREDQIAYASGSDSAKRDLQQRAQQRKAVFGGGGDFAANQQGVSGLSSGR